MKHLDEKHKKHGNQKPGPVERQPEADVVIIGGGITGAAIARELSKYKVDTILVEKGGELCAGSSKGTLGHIYRGLCMAGSLILKSVVLPPGTPLSELYHPHTLKMRWCEEGFKEWPQVLKDLDVKHSYPSLLFVAITEDQVQDLVKMRDLGRSIGGPYADFQRIRQRGNPCEGALRE